MKIFDEADGEVPAGVCGEIVLRGPIRRLHTLS
jgi:hypothetical protein